MKLEDLNTMNAQQRALLHEADKLAGRAKKYAEIRHSPATLSSTIIDWPRYDLESREFLLVVLNELGDDILRLAELRLEAMARERRERASIIKSQIEAVIGKGGDA